MIIHGMKRFKKYVCMNYTMSVSRPYLSILLSQTLVMLFLFLISCACKKDSIVIAYPSAPRSFDCHLRKELVTLSILYNIYEPLVSFDANMKIGPGLADYWEQEDSLTWTFYLRDGVVFHNGKTCGINDIIYSLYRPMNLPESEFTVLQDVLDTIVSEDDNKIIIKTIIPRTFVLYDVALIGIMPEGLDPGTEDPVGTGPYHLTESTEHKLTLEAFPQYWGEKPAIKRVEYYVIPDFEERFQMFAEGKADIISYVPIEAVERCEAIGRVVASPGVSKRYLELNLRKYPYNTREFRLAINLGIDREGIAREVYHGYAVPANQYINPGVFGYDPTRQNFMYDPDSAKKLISNLDDMPAIDLEYANVKYFIGEAIAKQLENIGLKVRTHSLPPDEFWARIEGRQSNCYLISMVPNSYEGIGDITSSFHTLQTAKGLGLQNRVGYSNRKLDAIIESLPYITDQQQVAQKISEIQDILVHDLPMIPLVWEKQIYCVSEKVEWNLRLDEFILIKDITITD
jgi:peptide/nickel transport system substrate-binding protein